MQKFLCVFLTIFLLCGVFATPTLAIRAPDEGNLIIDGIAPRDYYDDEERTSTFFKVTGLLILGCYFAFTSIYYFASRKNKQFSLTTCIKNFIPVGVATLLCFILSYTDVSLSSYEGVGLLCILALFIAPIYLFITTMLNVVHLFSIKQAEIEDYKAYVRKTLINITTFFVTNAISIAFLIIYGQIL